MNQHTKQTGKQTNTQTNKQATHTQTHSEQITHSRCCHCRCRCCCCCCCCCIDANNWRNELLLLLPIFNNRFREYLSGGLQVLPGVKWLIINAQLCICNAKVATGATAALPKHLMRRMRNILQCKLAKYRQMQSSLKDVYKFDCFIKISKFVTLFT